LNKPAPRAGTGDGLGRSDGPHTSSGDLSYLLEDDEEEPKRGWGKIVLVFAVLALAAGFGYWYWQQGGFDRLIASVKQPTAQTPDSSADTTPATNGPANASPSTSTAPPSTSDNAPSQPARSAPVPAPDAGTQSVPASTDPQNSSGAPAAPTDAPPTAAPSTAAPPNTAPSQPKAADDAASTKKHAPPAADSDSDQESSADEATTDAPKAVAKAPMAKPPAAKPVDAVTEAQRYIYGRGVRQDCDHGLRLLKSAQSNATAMISLGALYSTGTCTPRDLPTAYRWFALALHKQPENRALQDDLQKLWSQMTQPERQLAIKLSQ
jgi:hypothetical protein